MWFIIGYLWFVGGFTTVALVPYEFDLFGNVLAVLFWPVVAVGAGILWLWGRLFWQKGGLLH